LKEKFVTGSWRSGGENQHNDGELDEESGVIGADPDTAMSEAMRQEEVYGDWEDLEDSSAGVRASRSSGDEDDDNDDREDDHDSNEIGGSDEMGDGGEDEEDHGITYEDDGRRLGESKKEAHMRRQRAKDALKANFDAAYDQHQSGGRGGKKRRNMNGDVDADEVGSSIFDELKADAESQAKINAVRIIEFSVLLALCIFSKLQTVLILKVLCELVCDIRVNLLTRMLILERFMKVVVRGRMFALNSPMFRLNLSRILI